MFADHKLCLSYVAAGLPGRNLTYMAGGASTIDPNYASLAGGAVGTNIVCQIIDLGEASDGTAGDGTPVRIMAKMIADAAGASATLDILITTGPTEADVADTTILNSANHDMADMVAGYDFLPNMQFMSNQFERYVRMTLDQNDADFTAGLLFAGIIIDDQSN